MGKWTDARFAIRQQTRPSADLRRIVVARLQGCGASHPTPLVHGLGAAAHVKFFKDMMNVILYGRTANVERSRNFLVRQAFFDITKNFRFASRQCLQRTASTVIRPPSVNVIPTKGSNLLKQERCMSRRAVQFAADRTEYSSDQVTNRAVAVNITGNSRLSACDELAIDI